jgi:hypothetical protein
MSDKNTDATDSELNDQTGEVTWWKVPMMSDGPGVHPEYKRTDGVEFGLRPDGVVVWRKVK